MELLFTILLSGCSDDGLVCERLERMTVAAENRAACEQILDDRMAEETALWPVYLGICLEQEKGALSAALPDWWEGAAYRIAGPELGSTAVK